MQLKNVEIHNFLGIEKGIVNLQRTGTTLIKGVNSVSSTSVSNGAGKSSVFEAIYWALYGKTKRGLTGDSVINRAAPKKEPCSVMLSWDDYVVERTRRPNALVFKKVTATSIQDLTRGTIKDTQELIEEVVKISDQTFSKVAYFGQEDVKAFASLTDSELKKVFEQALGLTFITQQHEKAKAHVANLRNEIMVKQQNEVEFKNEIAATKAQIDLLERAAEDLAQRKESEQLRILADIAKDNAQLERIKLELVKKQAAVKTAEAALAGATRKLAELNDYRKRLLDVHSKKQHTCGRQLAQESMLAHNLKNLKAKWVQAPDMVGVPCSECKRPYTEKELADVRAGLQDQIAQAQIQLDEVKNDAMRHKLDVNEMEQALSKLDEVINRSQDELSQGQHRYSTPAVINREITLHRTSAEQLIQRVVENQTVLQKLSAADANYTKEIIQKHSWVEDREMELSFVLKDVAKLDHEFKIAEMLVEALGNAGMKSYIFDHVTPALNREINRYAKMLDDIEIEISTVTMLKSGEFREKFNIAVNNLNGSNEYDGNSGGEKQKINLAVALGFNKVFRTMAQGAVNAVFLDEPFEALDKGSSDAVIAMCNDLASIGNVYIITHQDSIQDLITDVIEVVKDGPAAHIK